MFTRRQFRVWLSGAPLCFSQALHSNSNPTGGSISSSELEEEFKRPQIPQALMSRPARSAEGKASNFPLLKALAEIEVGRAVHFDPAWDGPATAGFEILEDWPKRNEDEVRYYWGTAVYRKTITMPHLGRGQRVLLDLGIVKHIAEVTLNGHNLGVLWTAPWHIDITEAARSGRNQLEVAVSNVWANRLIGDEQQPPDMVWEKADIAGGSYLKEFPDWFLNHGSSLKRALYIYDLEVLHQRFSARTIGPARASEAVVRVVNHEWADYVQHLAFTSFYNSDLLHGHPFRPPGTAVGKSHRCAADQIDEWDGGYQRTHYEGAGRTDLEVARRPFQDAELVARSEDRCLVALGSSVGGRRW